MELSIESRLGILSPHTRLCKFGSSPMYSTSWDWLSWWSWRSWRWWEWRGWSWSKSIKMLVIRTRVKPGEPGRTLFQCGSPHFQCYKGIPRKHSRTLCSKIQQSSLNIIFIIIICYFYNFFDLQVEPSDSRLQIQTWSVLQCHQKYFLSQPRHQHHHYHHLLGPSSHRCPRPLHYQSLLPRAKQLRLFTWSC